MHIATIYYGGFHANFFFLRVHLKTKQVVLLQSQALEK